MGCLVSYRSTPNRRFVPWTCFWSLFTRSPPPDVTQNRLCCSWTVFLWTKPWQLRKRSFLVSNLKNLLFVTRVLFCFWSNGWAQKTTGGSDQDTNPSPDTGFEPKRTQTRWVKRVSRVLKSELVNFYKPKFPFQLLLSSGLLVSSCESWFVLFK